MDRRREPFPTWSARHFIRFQFAHGLPQISRARWHEAREKSHRAADSRIWRGIIRFAGEIGKLEPMGVDRHIPLHSEWQHRTSVVEMSVSQHDRLRSRTRAEARLSRFENLVRATRQSGVHQYPRPAGPADEIDIHETDRQPADIRCYAGDDSHCSGDGARLRCNLTWSKRICRLIFLHGIVSVWPGLSFVGSSRTLLFASRIFFQRPGDL